MENASKALIIAGAILLAIVIISLGLIVVNNTRESVDNSNLNEQELQSFNAKFSAFEGKISGSRVNTLIQQVIATNQAMINEGKEAQKYCIIVGFTNQSGTTAYVSTKSDGNGLVGKTGMTLKADGDYTYQATWAAYTGSTSVATGGSYEVTLFYSADTSRVHYIYIK